MPPVAPDEIDDQAEGSCHLAPERGEEPRLKYQHAVARRQCVDDGRLPSTGPRCGIDEDMAFRHLEDCLHAFEALLAEFRELGPAMVDGGKIHRPQDAVGHIRWAGDLQEVLAGGVRSMKVFAWEEGLTG